MNPYRICRDRTECVCKPILEPLPLVRSVSRTRPPHSGFRNQSHSNRALHVRLNAQHSMPRSCKRKLLAIIHILLLAQPNSVWSLSPRDSSTLLSNQAQYFNTLVQTTMQTQPTRFEVPTLFRFTDRTLLFLGSNMQQRSKT